MVNLSPEEILREREEEGGIQYDDTPKESTSVESVEKEHGAKTVESPTQSKEPETNPLMERIQQSERPNLGKVDTSQPTLSMGWKPVPVEDLPSRGLFYPEGTQIQIRPAEVDEIKHFSTLDENDRLSINESLNLILERCMRMNFPNGQVDYRDTIHEDRFYLILAIRDLTFLIGENRIILKPTKKCKAEKECPYIGGFELRSNVLSFFNVDSKYMKYYIPSEGAFVFTLRKFPDKPIRVYLPTIGVKEAIDNFKRNMTKSGQQVDESFMEIAPFLFADWRSLSDGYINQVMRQSGYWSREEFSLYHMVKDELKLGTKLEATLICPHCKESLVAPILFKNGIKSLFVISDIFGELLAD